MIYAIEIKSLTNAREFKMPKPQHLIRERTENCYKLLVIRLFLSAYCSVNLYCALCKCSALPLHVAPKILTFFALCYIYCEIVLTKWHGARAYLPSILVCRTQLTAPCHVRSLAISSASLVLTNLFSFLLQGKTVTDTCVIISGKYMLFLLYQTWIWWRDFHKRSYGKLNENPLSRSRVVDTQTNEGTDRHDEDNSHFSQYF